jgi:hypothetical protein
LTPIAQLAALTCHANARLLGLHLPRFFPTNSTCEFCDRIEFRRSGSADDSAESLLAATPDAWFESLPARGCSGVRMAAQPRNDPNISDRLSSGFVGGGHLFSVYVARDDGQSEIWRGDWQVWDRDAPKRRIWRVVYRLEETRPSELSIGRTLPIVRAAFRESIEEAKSFSERHTVGAFTKNFSEALDALDDPSADVGHYRDIALPGQLSDDALALLKASMRAWVFGGMGSWNDMSFEEPARIEYENISDRLFDLTHEAIVVAVNSTDRAT